MISSAVFLNKSKKHRSGKPVFLIQLFEFYFLFVFRKPLVQNGNNFFDGAVFKRVKEITNL